VIVIDLSALAFMDSTGLHLLLRLDDRFPERLRIISDSPSAEQLLELSGTRDRLPIIPKLPTRSRHRREQLRRRVVAVGPTPNRADNAMTDARTGDRINELRESGSDDGPSDGAAEAHAREEGFSCTHRAVPDSVAVLRATVAEFATKAGLPSSTIDRVKLAVSEAATNVVVHAYQDASEPGLIHVEAALTQGELHVSVADTGPGLRARPDSPGLGLGLALIDELTDNFELLQGGNGGLRVLMRFAIPPSPINS
jgi:serine/threonine-protein kinase RsbW